MVLLGFTSFEEFVMAFQLNSAVSGSIIMGMAFSGDSILENPNNKIRDAPFTGVQVVGVSTTMSDPQNSQASTS